MLLAIDRTQNKLWIDSEKLPEYARPTIFRPALVRYPEHSALRGREIPTAPKSLKSVEFGRPWINQEGINWWMSFFSSSSQLYTSVSVVLFDPFDDSWKSGSAIMWRPRFSSESIAGCVFRDFRIILEGVEFD